MHIHLRVNQEQGVNQVINHTFKYQNPLIIKLCPLPPFLEGEKCSCGNKADYITKDDSCICKSCVKSSFPQNKLVSKKDVFSPITEKTIKGIKFEWSVNRDRWYTLWGRKIITENWKSLIITLKDMILKNKVIELEGEYDRDTKMMTIS